MAEYDYKEYARQMRENCVKDHNGNIVCSAELWEELARIIENSEEVKHSRWENISGFDVCNICGTSPAYCEPKPNNPKGYPSYCHHCGAKMDGGKADDL